MKGLEEEEREREREREREKGAKMFLPKIYIIKKNKGLYFR